MSGMGEPRGCGSDRERRGQLSPDGKSMIEMEEGAQIYLPVERTYVHSTLSASSGVYWVCPVCQAPLEEQDIKAEGRGSVQGWT